MELEKSLLRGVEDHKFSTIFVKHKSTLPMKLVVLRADLKKIHNCGKNGRLHFSRNTLRSKIDLEKIDVRQEVDLMCKIDIGNAFWESVHATMFSVIMD